MTTHSQLLKDAENMFETAMHVLDTKGRDYAPEGDALSEFYGTANLLGITPQQVWAVHFMKQVKAVLRYVKDGKLSSETLESRLTDIINYAAILGSLDTEEDA